MNQIMSASINLAIAIGGIIVGVLGILLLLKQRQKPGTALGVGGSIILLSLILLAIVYGLINGIHVWITTGSALFIFVSFSYKALKRPSTSR